MTQDERDKLQTVILGLHASKVNLFATKSMPEAHDYVAELAKSSSTPPAVITASYVLYNSLLTEIARMLEELMEDLTNAPLS